MQGVWKKWIPYYNVYAFFRWDLWPKKVLLIQTFMGCLNQVDQGSNSRRALTGNIITNQLRNSLFFFSGMSVSAG